MNRGKRTTELEQISAVRLDRGRPLEMRHERIPGRIRSQ